ncbi:MAG: hypothetical protein E6Q97_17560 [Desulfurellales bacterium]|nr:MAG: hypothetical protein E6Q97_17560 [Desulfurellales bacterium]
MTTTKLYRVQPISGDSLEVRAKNEWVAIAKAHRLLTRKHVTAGDVRWNGVEAWVGGRSYCKPVIVGG